MNHAVIDSGLLIALERRAERGLVLADRILKGSVVAHVPTGVVAQVWRGHPRQHNVMRLLKHRSVRLHELTREAAVEVGVLLGESGTSDVVDGHVAVLARKHQALVLISDPGDIKKLDPALTVVDI